MDNENVEDLYLDEEQEEEESSEEEEEEEQPEEDVVTLPKDKFKSMQRKAIAYDAKKTKRLSTKGDSLSDEVVQSVRKLETIETKRQFGYENSLSPEETDFVFRVSNGEPTKETLSDPFVKSGLEGYRESKKIEANTPISSSRSTVFQGKEFKDMTEEERKANFNEASKKFKK